MSATFTRSPCNRSGNLLGCHGLLAGGSSPLDAESFGATSIAYVRLSGIVVSHTQRRWHFAAGVNSSVVRSTNCRDTRGRCEVSGISSGELLPHECLDLFVGRLAITTIVRKDTNPCLANVETQRTTP